jgi:hypothetical protein
MENLKLTPASDPEILRLLRAFFKIRDPRQRREIVTRVEWLASDQTRVVRDVAVPRQQIAPARSRSIDVNAVRADCGTS